MLATVGAQAPADRDAALTGRGHPLNPRREAPEDDGAATEYAGRVGARTVERSPHELLPDRVVTRNPRRGHDAAADRAGMDMQRVVPAPLAANEALGARPAEIR